MPDMEKNIGIYNAVLFYSPWRSALSHSRVEFSIYDQARHCNANVIMYIYMRCPTSYCKHVFAPRACTLQKK